MASLVANYGSGSDSELDSDDDRGNLAVNTSSVTNEEIQVAQISTGGENLLMGSMDSSSDSEEEKGDKYKSSTLLSQRQCIPKLPNPLAINEPLPTPTLGKPKRKRSKTDKVSVKNSVFANPFLEAETAKHSILEKHVKMTEDALRDQKSGKPKKQMCYKFKKGKCQFGSKCKYSHDLDNVPGVVQVQDDANVEISSHDQSGKANAYYGNPPQNFTPVLEDDDSYMAQAKRKRKSGVTDTLHPPKRAQKHLDNQRANERPWTANR